MLFQFVMNFLNIEKNKIFVFVFSKFHVFFTFHAISNINFFLGANFFFRKTIISHFTFYAIFNINKKY